VITQIENTDAFVIPEGPDGAGPPLEAPRRVELSGAVLSFPAPG